MCRGKQPSRIVRRVTAGEIQAPDRAITSHSLPPPRVPTVMTSLFLLDVVDAPPAFGPFSCTGSNSIVAGEQDDGQEGWSRAGSTWMNFPRQSSNPATSAATSRVALSEAWDSTVKWGPGILIHPSGPPARRRRTVAPAARSTGQPGPRTPNFMPGRQAIPAVLASNIFRRRCLQCRGRQRRRRGSEDRRLPHDDPAVVELDHPIGEMEVMVVVGDDENRLVPGLGARVQLERV